MMIPEQLFGGVYECDSPIPGNAYVNGGLFPFLWDEVWYGGNTINLSDITAEWEYFTENPDATEIPDDYWDGLEIDEPEYLIGDWKKNQDGIYEIVPNCNGCGFAASIVWLGGAPIIVVEWSETITKVRALCSPCCPGQADLDSGLGNIAAYTLPSEFYGNELEEG